MKQNYKLMKLINDTLVVFLIILMIVNVYRNQVVVALLSLFFISLTLYTSANLKEVINSINNKKVNPILKLPQELKETSINTKKMLIKFGNETYIVNYLNMLSGLQLAVWDENENVRYPLNQLPLSCILTIKNEVSKH